MYIPKKVKMVEVGARDGLQNEKTIIPSAVKIDFINRLTATGLPVIEATSFVSAKKIPQLADSAEVFAGIIQSPAVSYPVLVPNPTGFEYALRAGVKEIAVFTTSSEIFCQRNLNKSVHESLDDITKVIAAAKKNHIKIRGYLSCVLGCPYEGEMAPAIVADLAKRLYELGCYEISLGDTIGVGTPLQTQILLETVKQQVPTQQLAVHFHDTYGQALANIYVALSCGIATIDSSVAGLGGCPYAQGASGNIASEDVLYMLNGMGIETGVDLSKLVTVGRFITAYLQKPMQSKVNIAMQSTIKN